MNDFLDRIQNALTPPQVEQEVLTAMKDWQLENLYVQVLAALQSLLNKGRDVFFTQMERDIQHDMDALRALQDLEATHLDLQDLSEKVNLMQALLILDAERTLPLLERELASRSESWRLNLCELAQQFGNTQLQDSMLQLALNDPDSIVRFEAVQFLALHGNEGSVDALRWIAIHDQGHGITIHDEANPIAQLANKAMMAILSRTSGGQP